jgi:DNA polymerase III gamma/tau subunit
MPLADSIKPLSHHSYCLIGSDPARADLISMLEKRHKIKIHGNPDFFDRRYETFTIDDARELKAKASMRPVTDYNSANDSKSTSNQIGGGKKIFVLTMNGITVEAQNALLKLLEEPPEYTHFFLVIPSAHLLLLTVKSRLSMMNDSRFMLHEAQIGAHPDVELIESVKKFVASPKPKRLEQVKTLMDAISKEKKTKQDAIDFIDALEVAMYSNGGAKKNIDALKAVELARKYMNDRSPSMKMLLEYVSLNI